MATTQTTTAQAAATNFFVPPKSTTAASTTAPAPAKAVERTRTYKDFLTSTLHTRFRHSSYLLLSICYTLALLLRFNWTSILPIRALLLFIPCLAIFIVRVSNLHIGRPTSASPAEGLWKSVRDWRTPYTIGWYIFSAWFFGEVYLWSRGHGDNLGWVDTGRRFDDEGVWERPLLNENPVFLRALWSCLGLAQAGLHLWRGVDRVSISEKEREGARVKEKVESTSRFQIPESLHELANRTPTILGDVLRLLIPGVALTLPLYLLIIRHLIWPYFYPIARLFFSTLPDHARPTGLQHMLLLSWQTLSSSFTLILLWELSNAIFTTFISRPPLRKDQPLTNEIKDAAGHVVNRSKDPNGSLLSGLRSRKEVARGFAFWELWLICEKFDVRRKTIYTEVDRAGGSTWLQISQICLDELKAVETRCKTALAPPTPQTQLQSNPVPDNTAQLHQQGSLSTLPRISDRSVIQNGDIFTKPPKTTSLTHRAGDIAGDFAKSIGQDPQGPTVVQQRARKAIEWSADRVLTKSEQQHLSRQALVQDANSFFVKVLRSPVGEPFRRTFARKVKGVVFGSPNSKKADIIHASKSLSVLCVHSLKEDDYGQVARSIPLVLRTYTSTIDAVVSLLGGARPSWTDVEFTERRRRVREVEELIDVLKAGLEGVVLGFGEYADSVGVTKKEMREAREALGKGVEMVQT